MKKLLNELSHPLVGCRVSVLLKLLAENEIELKFLPRFFLILLLSSLLVPIRIMESFFFGTAIRNIKIHDQPVFILGHWRSGTTHLHNILSLDKSFGYLNTFQAVMPTCFLLNLSFHKKITAMLLPEKRPMDNMIMSLEAPYEEDFAIGNLSKYAVTHGMWFPKRLRRYFEENVYFNATVSFREEWKKHYINLLKKISYFNSSKPLLLKNPPNTARVDVLLEIFPNAKFIHIYRDPYVIYPSTNRLYTKLMENRRFNTISEAEKEDIILENYERIINKFLEDKKKIPEQNIVEIKFEEFEMQPMLHLKKIYTKFGFENFKSMKPIFSDYLGSLIDYEKNNYLYSDTTRKKISTKWSKTISTWNYTSEKKKTSKS